MPRVIISDDCIKDVTHELIASLSSRIIEKGSYSFTSSHEILGIVAEEYDEFLEAVRTNDKKQLKKELLDLGVAIIWALASDKIKALDW